MISPNKINRQYTSPFYQRLRLPALTLSPLKKVQSKVTLNSPQNEYYSSNNYLILGRKTTKNKTQKVSPTKPSIQSNRSNQSTKNLRNLDDYYLPTTQNIQTIKQNQTNIPQICSQLQYQSTKQLEANHEQDQQSTNQKSSARLQKISQTERLQQNSSIQPTSQVFQDVQQIDMYTKLAPLVQIIKKVDSTKSPSKQDIQRLQVLQIQKIIGLDPPSGQEVQKLLETCPESQQTMALIQQQPTATSVQTSHMSRQSQHKNSIQTLSDYSLPDHDEYDIWDNSELQIKGINIDELNKVSKTERMLKLYKIRFGQFPLQREQIDNDNVIKNVKKIACSNSKLYRQYFKQNEPLIFNDTYDYSKQTVLIEDPNFKNYISYQKSLKPNRHQRRFQNES